MWPSPRLGLIWKDLDTSVLLGAGAVVGQSLFGPCLEENYDAAHSLFGPNFDTDVTLRSYVAGAVVARSSFRPYFGKNCDTDVTVRAFQPVS